MTLQTGQELIAQTHCLPMSTQRLADENRQYRGTGGVSERNRRQRFKPAFLDHATGRVYRSLFANGQPAPIHILDGLEEKLLNRCSESGRIISAAPCLESGFVRCGKFYSRSEAAAAVRQGPPTESVSRAPHANAL